MVSGTIDAVEKSGETYEVECFFLESLSERAISKQTVRIQFHDCLLRLSD